MNDVCLRSRFDAKIKTMMEIFSRVENIKDLDQVARGAVEEEVELVREAMAHDGWIRWR